MGVFSPQGITDVGRMLLTAVQSGAAVFDATKLVIGSGNMPTGATVASMTAVVTPVKELAITKKKQTNDGKAIFGGVYSNEDITTAFYWREFALYARPMYVAADGSKTYGDEVLYAYGNAGNTADHMPAYSTSTAIEKELDMIVWVGNEATVNLEIASGIYATREEVVLLDGSKSMTGNALYLSNRNALVGANDTRAVLNTYDEAGSEENYRGIVVRNKNETASDAEALCLAIRKNNGAEALFHIYGEHNKPSASDVGAMPIINGAAMNMDTVLSEGNRCFHTFEGSTLGTPYKYGKTTYSSGIILTYSGGGYGIQFALVSGQYMFVRNIDNGNIGEWRKVYDEGNKPTAADVGAGTLAGKVVANASAVTDYAAKQVRNIVMAQSTTGVSLSNGDVLHVYES